MPTFKTPLKITKKFNQYPITNIYVVKNMLKFNTYSNLSINLTKTIPCHLKITPETKSTQKIEKMRANKIQQKNTKTRLSMLNTRQTTITLINAYQLMSL